MPSQQKLSIAKILQNQGLAVLIHLRFLLRLNVLIQQADFLRLIANMLEGLFVGLLPPACHFVNVHFVTETLGKIFGQRFFGHFKVDRFDFFKGVRVGGFGSLFARRLWIFVSFIGNRETLEVLIQGVQVFLGWGRLKHGLKLDFTLRERRFVFFFNDKGLFLLRFARLVMNLLRNELRRYFQCTV